ncbi:thioredoxin-dependent thiol peroxidase [Candidatus Peregrinibacteria bacterium]|nr:thioredoxin-dependent thiol peroxidase [Candidatus Peregrinibacteria bacterium]
MKDLVGKKAPDFKLMNDEGKETSLADYKGKMVLLYFYPKDMTPGCTTEACTLRDRMNDLKALNVVVLGVSADSVESHKKFKAKERLNFPLLSDPDRKVLEAYSVWREKSMYGRLFMGIVRESFLIDKNGIVVKHYNKVKPAEHAQEVIDDVKAL